MYEQVCFMLDNISGLRYNVINFYDVTKKVFKH